MSLEIREAVKEDAELISAWINDPRVRKYLTSNLRSGKISAGLIRAALRRPNQRWFIFSVEDIPVGLVAFDQIDEVDGVANIWYFVGHQEFLGQGLASTAVRQVVGANPLSLRLATAWVGEQNKASLRSLEKAGFRKVGEYTGAFFIDGVRTNRVLYERPFGA